MRTNCFWGFLILSCFSISFIPTQTYKTPPGTVLLKPGLYIDQGEITNFNWREYVAWISQNEPENLNQVLPDTLVWRFNSMDSFGYHAEALTEQYFRHPFSANDPVVGISYEQAVAFCKWRSNMVNKLYETLPTHPLKGKKVQYRLPTKEEWEFAASGGLNISDYPYGMKTTYSQKKGYQVNCREYLASNKSKKNIHYYVVPYKSFVKNKYGLYNMIGNVSEMISEKGIAKGGNFSLPLANCAVNLDQPYDKPTSWLGFRSVCELID